jgi:four helix bundle protein
MVFCGLWRKLFGLTANLIQMSDGLLFGFEALELWKKARAMKCMVAELVRQLPAEERFRLCDQLIRSSRSVCSLIAEGHGRYTWRDQLHYCIQARGSLTETMNHLLDAADNGFISSNVLASCREQLKETERLLNGYISYLRTKSAG